MLAQYQKEELDNIIKDEVYKVKSLMLKLSNAHIIKRVLIWTLEKEERDEYLCRINEYLDSEVDKMERNY